MRMKLRFRRKKSSDPAVAVKPQPTVSHPSTWWHLVTHAEQERREGRTDAESYRKKLDEARNRIDVLIATDQDQGLSAYQEALQRLDDDEQRRTDIEQTVMNTTADLFRPEDIDDDGDMAREVLQSMELRCMIEPADMSPHARSQYGMVVQTEDGPVPLMDFYRRMR